MVVGVSAGGGVVLLVGHVLSPLGFGAVLALGQTVPNGEVSHEMVRRRPVPVPLRWRAPGSVARPDQQDRAAAGLCETYTLGDVQGLAVGVAVPGGPGAGGEVHRIDLAATLTAGGDDIEVHIAGEPLGRPFC